MQRMPWSTSRGFWHEDNSPVTKILIGAAIISCLLELCRVPLTPSLGYVAPLSFVQPWRLLTYPLVGNNLFSVIFYAVSLWMFGSSLERSWGSKFYVGFFICVTIITAIGMTLAGFIFKTPTYVTFWLPGAAMVMVWCLLNPEEELRYFLFPIKAKWLAVIEVVGIFAANAPVHPMMGVLALSGCGAAYAWYRLRGWGRVKLYSTMPVSNAKKRNNLRLVSKPTAKPLDDKFSLRDLNPFEILAKRKRRKQFEKLMDDD